MYSTFHDESEKLIGVLPELREHAARNERFGMYGTRYIDLRKLLTKLFEEHGYTTGRHTLDRVMRVFVPFGQRHTKFVDKTLLQTLLVKNISENAVFDILYFHHCWTTPILRKLLVSSFYPYMKARDQISRERVIADIEEILGKFSSRTVSDVLFPLRNHGFMDYSKRTSTDQFTYRTVHPFAFLYASYRELERLNLKVMGVHRLDSLLDLDYTKWFLLTRSQLTEIAKQLDEEKLAGYSFQIEEQIQLKYRFNELLEKLKSEEVKK